jgi:hypothetical protein
MTVLATLIGLGAWWFPKSSGDPAPVAGTAVASATSSSATSSGGPAVNPILASVVFAGNAGAPDCGARGYLLPNGLAQLKGDPVPADDLGTWFQAHGGVEVVNNVTFTVESSQPSAAILTGLRAVVDRRSAASGAVGMVFQCGGQLDQRFFVLNLATATPSLKAFPGDPLPGSAAMPAVTFPFTVSSTDPEDFVVLVKRPPGDVSWHLELSWTYQGATGVTRIPQGNGEFRTTSAQVYIAATAQDLLDRPQASDGLWHQ